MLEHEHALLSLIICHYHPLSLSVFCSPVYKMPLLTPVTPTSYRAYTSPAQTSTPLSMSDDDTFSSPEPHSRPAPGMLTEGPNARSKTISTADGDDTYGVSILFYPFCIEITEVGGGADSSTHRPLIAIQQDQHRSRVRNLLLHLLPLDHIKLHLGLV